LAGPLTPAADQNSSGIIANSLVNKPRVSRPASLRQFSLSRKLPPIRIPDSAARKAGVKYPKPGRSVFYAMTQKKKPTE